MEIIKTLNGKELTIAVVGEINSITAKELDDEISKCLEGIETLIFEFKDLDYISSAGLRVLLVANKIMAKQGKMIVRNPNGTQIVKTNQDNRYLLLHDLCFLPRLSKQKLYHRRIIHQQTLHTCQSNLQWILQQLCCRRKRVQLSCPQREHWR